MQRQVSIIRKKEILKFPDCRQYAQYLAPENIRKCTRAGRITFRSNMMKLAGDEKTLETNKMLLLQYATRNSAEENPVDWDNLGAQEEEEEVHPLQRRHRDDHVACRSAW
ncbi:UMP-CMP kinase [Hordeum vulgare]|nr:UMP-CMP kinase [Hordeum vulgare]